jgi:hypothetical protein
MSRLITEGFQLVDLKVKEQKVFVGSLWISRVHINHIFEIDEFVVHVEEIVDHFLRLGEMSMHG